MIDGSADVCDARASSERHAARKEAIRDLTLKRYLSIEADEVQDVTITATPVAAPSFKMVMKKRKP